MKEINLLYRYLGIINTAKICENLREYLLFLPPKELENLKNYLEDDLSRKDPYRIKIYKLFKYNYPGNFEKILEEIYYVELKRQHVKSSIEELKNTRIKSEYIRQISTWFDTRDDFIYSRQFTMPELAFLYYYFPETFLGLDYKKDKTEFTAILEAENFNNTARDYHEFTVQLNLHKKIVESELVEAHTKPGSRRRKKESGALELTGIKQINSLRKRFEKFLPVFRNLEIENLHIVEYQYIKLIELYALEGYEPPKKITP